MSAAPLHWRKMVSSTNLLVRYKGKQNVSRASPTRLTVAYSFGCSERKRKHVFSKTGVKVRDKRTSVTAMQAQFQAFTILPPPLISYKSLSLS
jgi:hypothetical protein